jgi:hypothetical protein
MRKLATITVLVALVPPVSGCGSVVGPTALSQSGDYRDFTISGHVVDQQTGDPVPGVRIFTRTYDGRVERYAWQAESDGYGFYELTLRLGCMIDNEPILAITLWVTKDGYGTWGGENLCELSSGTYEIDFALRPIPHNDGTPTPPSCEGVGPCPPPNGWPGVPIEPLTNLPTCDYYSCYVLDVGSTATFAARPFLEGFPVRWHLEAPVGWDPQATDPSHVVSLSRDEGLTVEVTGLAPGRVALIANSDIFRGAVFIKVE